MEIRSLAPALRVTFALLAPSLVACGEDPHTEEEHGRVARLVVSDGEVGRLTIVDLEHGEVLGTYDVTAPASLYAAPGGRFAYAHQTAAGVVNFVDSGISVTSHGDHGHVDVEDPSLLAFTLTGVAPVHFTHHDGQAAIFFDGRQPSDELAGVSANVAIVPDISLIQGMPESVNVPLDVAQHGVAVPVGNGLIISADVPAPTGTGNPLPNGVIVTDWEGNVLQTFDGSCTGLHGEASLSHDRIAFACADHVLLLEREDEDAPFTTRTLDYPDTRRAGTLAASNDGAYLFGNHADETRNGVIRIDVTTGAVEEVSFGADVKVARFAVPPGLDDALVVLTTDGTVHVIDVATFEVVHTWDVVAPFTTGHGTPSPALAVADDVAYVSDTAMGRVHELEIGERARGRTLEVGGRPTSIVVLGPATEAHDDDAHDH